MTALHAAIEHSVLGWVKPELDDTLRMARVEIEGYLDDPADTSRMQVCGELLHQVQGTLRMVELYAPAMVAEEMEQLSYALRTGAVADRNAACAALVSGVVQLPDYLERLQSGHKEIPIVLLPLLNELRAVRGEAGLSESVLFAPDLDKALPASLPRVGAATGAARAAEVAPFLARLRDVLQSWPEQGDPADPEGLHFSVEALLARTGEESPRRMLWVASLVADALRARGMRSTPGLRQAFASVERESRRIFDQGMFDAPRADAVLEPTRQLLYHVSQSNEEHPSLHKLREVFELDALRPTESELDHARGSVTGVNRTLLDTVAAAVKEDLLRVKDALDLYLRTGQNDPGALKPQADALQRVSDTLGMLGLGLARSLVQQQRDAMQDIVDGSRKADETALLDIAGALLYVDASLDDQVARLASGDAADSEDDLAAAEARKVLDVLLREAITNFANARQSFVAFVETGWNHAELEQVPKLLRDVSGALHILELPQPAEYLDGVRFYTEVELLNRHRIPNSRQIDTFADALASIEYYLEALRESRANRDDILDITRNSLETLGYWPLPEIRPEAVAPVASTPAPVTTPVAAPAVAPVVVPPMVVESVEPVVIAPIEPAPVESPAAEPMTFEVAPVEAEAVADDDAAIELEAMELDAVELDVVELDAAEPDPAELDAVAVEVSGSDGDVVESVALDGITLDDVTFAPIESASAEPTPAEPAAIEFAPIELAPIELAPVAEAPVIDIAPVVPAIPVEAVAAPAAVASAVAPVAIAAGFDTSSDDIDDEIREIFLEEFEEEIGNLRTLLPAWRKDPGNVELLQPVRRVFHTLKGSGRLVGAKTLGEFSWKIENMLNKVRDGLRPATPPVVAMVDHAFETLPQLHAALRDNTLVTADLPVMESFAERIAAGEDVMPTFRAAPPVMAPVETPVAVEAPVDVIAEELAAETGDAEDTGVPFRVDAVLFEILQAEVGGHLHTIDGWLARARATGRPRADEPLLRAIHTMNGAFAMTEVPAITDALTPAEGYVRRLLASGEEASPDGIEAIDALTGHVRATIAALSVEGGRVPRCDALAARLVALRDSLPEPKPVAPDHPVGFGLPGDAQAHRDTLEGVDLAALDLTELDLSAYRGFDAAPAEPAQPAPTAQPAGLDADAPVASAELELSQFFGTDVPADAPVAVPTQDDAARLLGLMEGLEAERLEAERLEAERLEAERLEAERLEAERLEAERLEAERLEAERLEAERLEAERLEAERVEAERVEAERLEAERLEAERLEAERLEAERLEAERLEAERVEAERLEAERLEAERLEAERLEAERLEAERLEAERLEAERLEAERLEAERLEAERLEAELLDAERRLAEAEAVEDAQVEAIAADDVTEAVELEAIDLDTLTLEAIPASTGESLDFDVSDVVDATPEPTLEAPVVETPAAFDLAAIAAPAAVAGLVAYAVPVVDPDEGLDVVDLDEELVDIFVEEGHDLLDHSDGLLSRLREAPEEREVIIGLQRDLHTLKGGARMAGVMSVGELGHAMESLLEAVAEHRQSLEKQDIPLLESGFDRLHTMVTRVGERRAVTMPTALIEAFEARSLGKPLPQGEEPAPQPWLPAEPQPVEPQPVPVTEFMPADEAPVSEAPASEGPVVETPALDVQDVETVFEAFVPEEIASEEITPATSVEEITVEELAIEELAGEELVAEEIALESDVPQFLAETDAVETAAAPSTTDAASLADLDLDALADIDFAKFVDAGAFEIPSIEAESVPETVESAETAEDAVDTGFDLAPEIEQQADTESDAPSEVEAEAAIGEHAGEWLHAQPEEQLEGQPEAQLEEQPVAQVEREVFAPLAALKPLSEPIDFNADADDEFGLRSSQEQVRVRAELLDRLVNYAGEVAIYRSRLEQQLGAFRGATSEMEQTNTRLRDQLRRLEIETEAQIIARYQREGETRDSTFDPLELDRFSNLQQLSRALVETSADLTSLQTTLEDMTQQYETLLLQQSRVSSELQEGLMRTRMVPFDTVVPRLRRVLRQAATDTGKQVQLKLDGAQGELDRNVLERMTAPLEHMLRNAVAHGLELPAQRRQSGKGEEGTVTIAVRKEGSEVVLQISDDGRGLDREAIRVRGEARGLVHKHVALSNAQLDALIFEPGFSTAEEVTRLAGRGVGMDVVASEVRQLGGSIDIQSEFGKGTVFTLRLPQTLAVTQAAFVRIGETTFAVPIASVRGVGRIPRGQMDVDGAVYRYGNEEYALHDLGKLIGHAPAKAEGQLQMPLLLTRSGDLHVAVSVDQILGNREIVVKPIGPQVASIPGIFGATIMGDGSVVVILDVAPLVRRQAALLAEQEELAPTLPAEQRQVPLVMVVDDSITMRKVTGRVLERHNFEVITAKDGLDALERMAERVPDLMLLDIEMPRMDGYELATAMKAETRLAGVPIIMITSRTGDKHRQRAMDIGVDRYLGKPYQENELMRNVFALLELAGSNG